MKIIITSLFFTSTLFFSQNIIVDKNSAIELDKNEFLKFDLDNFIKNKTQKLPEYSLLNKKPENYEIYNIKTFIPKHNSVEIPNLFKVENSTTQKNLMENILPEIKK